MKRFVFSLFCSVILFGMSLLPATAEGISLDIRVKAPFRNHTDTYENGVLTVSEIEEIIKAG